MAKMVSAQVSDASRPPAVVALTAKMHRSRAVRAVLWFFVVVCFPLVDVVHAQNMAPVSTPGGCTFFQHPFTAVKLKGSQHYKGDCVNGLAQGQGYALLDFGSEQALVLSRWERGLQTGASLTLYRQYPGRLAFTDNLRGVQGTAVTRDQGWTRSQIDDEVRSLFARVGSHATLAEAVISETAHRWNKLPRRTTPAEVFAQMEAVPTVTVSPTTPTDSTDDDPKARGRSARVM